jgi:hypothetical protein
VAVRSDVPKLFVNAEPGRIVRGRIREFIRTWPNHTEVIVNGSHFIQEDSPDEIGTASAEFVSGLRASGQTIDSTVEDNQCGTTVPEGGLWR